jgi:hypothetical protein
MQVHHSSEIFQFIDHAGEFAKEDKGDKKSLITFLDEKSQFTSRGFDYSVVAILGPQSSGKSTLLNLLFGTKFDEMDALSGRQQTTQGVWMGVSAVDSHAILVMDVEGTDGRERGEADVFERRTSLFSLTITSVLIINMWMNDIGRFHAANMGLLKTIFEMNLQLFKDNQELSQTKTLLLFIIRDYIGTPLEKLKGTLLSDLDRLWTGISKPDQYAESKVTDFFDIDFAWLPHKVLVPDEFVRAVGALKERFFKMEHPEFLLKKAYDKLIPADGFGDFASNIWEVVKSNKDLRIPTQKEALALIRCEEIQNTAFSTFSRDLESLSREVDVGTVVENFGNKIHNHLQKALKSYDELASRYHAETASRKRVNLVERIVSSLHVLFERQVERLRSTAIDIFRERAHLSLRDSDSSTAALAKDFIEHIDRAQREALDYFDEKVKTSLLPSDICEWNYSMPLEELYTSIAAETDHFRKDLLQLLMANAKDELEVNLRVPISRVLQQAPNNMWSVVRDYFDTALEKSIVLLKPCLEALSPNLVTPAGPRSPIRGAASSDDVIRKYLDQVRAHGFSVVRKCTKDAVVHLGRMMQSKFDAVFNFDSNNLPRRWSRKDDIPAIFKKSRAVAESLIDLYAVMRLLPEEDKIVFFVPEIEGDPELAVTPTDIRDDDPRIILTHSECVALLDQERAATNQSYKAAIQDQETATTAGYNPLVIIIIVILGWNEFITVLSWILGPLLIPILLLLAGIGYLIYAGQLGGPTLRLITTIAGPTLHQFYVAVLSFFDSIGQGRAAPRPNDNHHKSD